MRAVVDTNVLVSGLISSQGAPAKILDLIMGHVLTLVVDDRIMAEYWDVLNRRYFDRYFNALERTAVLEFLTVFSEKAIPCVAIPRLSDPGDIPFLEVALSAGVPLVTGNKKHFVCPPGKAVQIYAPGEFLLKFCGM